MERRARILIVEDERIAAEDMRRTLEYLGYSVTGVVSSSEDALREAERNKPDLVLMDIKLRGGMDGVEVAKRIRRSFDVPIVYITALTDKSTLQRAKVTEPFGYVHKPTDDKELYSAVEMALFRSAVEHKLKESEERYRILFDGSRDAIFITGEDGRFMDVNEAASVLTGYSKDELLKMAIRDLHEPEDLHAYKEYFHRIMQGEQLTSEAKILRKDGTKVDTEFSNRRVVMGGVPYMHTVARDITDRKRAEKALRESEARFRLIADFANDWETFRDREGNLIYVSPSFERITGYGVDDHISGKIGYAELFHPEDLGKANEHFSKPLRGESFNDVEFKVTRKDGKLIHVSASAQPVVTGAGEIVGMRASIRDITARKKIEEEKEKLHAQLIHSEKMAGIGTLTSGIAHEFNNLLQVIKGYTEFARKTKKSEDIEEALDTVLSHSDRASKIINDLLLFSSMKPSKKEAHDIREIVESVLSLTEEMLEKNNIKVVRKFSKIPPVEVSRGEMEQVFLNMVTNARDAMLAKGGRLEISAKCVRGNVEIRFADTGVGIEEHKLARIFEPFYTTKVVTGKSEIPGIGLGLSVSYGIVKRHGGTIEVESKLGRGTTFTVKLPIRGRREKKGVRRKKGKSQKAKPKPLNILVVDDEKYICKMVEKWLFLEGHTVKSALRGNQAIALVEKEYFHVVFLDIVMPGISGAEALERIKTLSPHTRVIMMTGRLLDKDLRDTLKAKGASDFIQKPFRMEDLIRTLEG